MAMIVHFNWHAVEPREGRTPTIYEALKTALGREPTHAELVNKVKAILDDCHCALAEAGKLNHQRGR